jgi:flagellar protein FliO/FliZ
MRWSQRCVQLAAGVVLLVGQCSVFAVDVNTPKPAPVVAANPLNLILGVVFLFALVAGAWWLLRRAGTMQWPSQRAAMKVLASMPVGPRERVVLVEIGGEQWALGVAPGRVSLLHRFEEPVITGGNQSDEFANRLRQVLQNSFGSQK